MNKRDEYRRLAREDVSWQKDCEFCKENALMAGAKTPYGAFVVLREGMGDDAWFCTLSPKTGGDPKRDFTIQLMPVLHLTHLSQLQGRPELARNYGTALSKVAAAMTSILMEEKDVNAEARIREEGAAIACYGKCTTWKEKKEHLHIKLFQFRGDLGQPVTVDSSFGKKEREVDPRTGKEFVRFDPVTKKDIPARRLKALSKKIISLLT